jgi:arginine deiminase
MTAHVSSEIGRMRAVLVHSPGPELLAVTPSNRADYLYDDIIEAESAQREHRRFIAILERFATVFQVRSLLADILSTPESRELLVRETMDIVPSEPLARDISELDAAALVKLLIEGKEVPPGPVA